MYSNKLYQIANRLKRASDPWNPWNPLEDVYLVEELKSFIPDDVEDHQNKAIIKEYMKKGLSKEKIIEILDNNFADNLEYDSYEDEDKKGVIFRGRDFRGEEDVAYWSFAVPPNILRQALKKELQKLKKAFHDHQFEHERDFSNHFHEDDAILTSVGKNVIRKKRFI